MLGEGVLPITIHSATNLTDVERMGKQDPYIKFTTDITSKDSFQQTSTKEDAGENATWDESYEVPLTGETTDLYIEVMDKEKGVDQIIAFAAIPLAQVARGPFSGLFDLYNIKGDVAGKLHLTLGNVEEEPTPGRSYINQDHLERAKGLHHKALAGDIGTAAIGAGLAIGAGFLGKQLWEEYKQKKAEEEE
ncbi:C2 domain-containing protein [Fennellomyces sp. T-0311]|nr:C2 domain-containing protein [Fennellomyces sp. T-0311]